MCTAQLCRCPVKHNLGVCASEQGTRVPLFTRKLLVRHYKRARARAYLCVYYPCWSAPESDIILNIGRFCPHASVTTFNLRHFALINTMLLLLLQKMSQNAALLQNHVRTQTSSTPRSTRCLHPYVGRVFKICIKH